MWTSSGQLISDFGNNILCTKSSSYLDDNTINSNDSQDGQKCAGSPQNYVVSVSQSKKYLFSFMMKEPNVNDGNQSDREQAIRIKNMTKEDRLKSLSNEADPAFYFAPNAFINVIDITREEVVARIKISGSKEYSNYFGYEKDYQPNPESWQKSDVLPNNVEN